MTIVILAGATLLALAAYSWESPYPARLLAYLAASCCAGLMRIWLTSRVASYSMASLYILLAMAVCTYSEIMVIAFLSVGVETAVQTRRRPKVYDIAFNGSAMTIAVWLSLYPSRLMVEAGSQMLLPLALTISAGLIYVAYTFLLCGRSLLREGSPFFPSWDEWLTSTFGYHLLGSTVAIILSVDPRIGDWRLPFMVLPFAYVIYYYYRQSRTKAKP